MKYIPSEPQRAIIEHLHANPRCNVFASPGTGKTAATLTALENLTLTDYIYPVLVIGPLRVANSVWCDEVSKWDHLQHLTVRRVLGTAEQRCRAIDGVPAHIYTIHYGLLKWLHEYLDGRWPFNTVICDESSRLKNHRCSYRRLKNGKWSFRASGTVNAANLMRYALRTRRWINLTGTPASNGLQNLWAQHFPVDHGNTLGRSFKAFTTRWFRTAFGSKPEWNQIEPLPHAFDEITRRMKPTSLSINARDYFNVSEPKVTDIEIKLPEAQMKDYCKLHREAVLKLSEETTITAVNAGVIVSKCLQYASGHIYDNDGQPHWKHDVKLEALKSLIEELNGAPLIVAYHFKPDRERILKEIPGAEPLPTGARQQDVERRWNAGQIPVLVIHPASAGHGLNLQYGGHHMCIYSPSFDLEFYEQVIERIGPVRQKQAGYDRVVHIYRLVAQNTFDELVCQRLSKKADLQALLLKELKDER